LFRLHSNKPGETRNGLIRKELREWPDKKTIGSPGWPLQILEWLGVPDTPPFKSYRGELFRLREVAFREIPARHQCAERLGGPANGP